MSDHPSGGRGHLELICGCMFSGKSERVVARVREAKTAGRTVAAFKHASDDRYAETQIVTHNGQRADAEAVGAAAAIVERSGGADLVVIDEAQFFGDELVGACRALIERGTSVVVAGLDRDSWGEPFGPMPAVEAMADTVTRTTATCSVCGGVADHTFRAASVEGTKMVGGAESYEARCGTCWFAPPAELRR